MSNIDSTVVLQIDGVDWQGWKTVEITRQVDAIAGSFSLSLSDRWQADATALPLAAGLPCKVLGGGVLMLTGYLDDYKPGATPTEHSITVSGRDKSADLVDCGAVHKPGHWQGLTALQLAQIFAKPFGVAVTASGDVGAPYPSFKLEQGETAHEALDRALRQRELLAIPDGSGGLVLARIGANRSSTMLEHGPAGNVTTISATYSMKDRYSEYVVQGQQPGTDDMWGTAAAAVTATVRDPAVKRYRPFIIRAENQVNSTTAHKRAVWECTVRAARAVTVEVTVPGWHDNEGKLWAVNCLVPVKLPFLRIEQDLLISKTVHSKGPSGTLTKLELRDPKAFLPEPEKKKKGSGTSGGGEWPDLQQASSTTSYNAHAKIREGS